MNLKNFKAKIAFLQEDAKNWQLIAEEMTASRDGILEDCSKRREEAELRFRDAIRMRRREYLELANLTESLFEAIKHGDEAHQVWLKDAISQHFACKHPRRDRYGECLRCGDGE